MPLGALCYFNFRLSFLFLYCNVYHIKHKNTAIKQTNNKNLFLSLRSCLHKKIAKFHVNPISFKTDLFTGSQVN